MMKNRKNGMARLLAGLLGWMLLLSAVGSTALGEEGQAYQAAYDYNEITIGNTTRMHGQFFTGLWGNATSDLDVRHLLHDYNLVKWDGELGMFRVNHSVVSGTLQTEDAEGNRSYLLSLYDDLSFSDGTPITAWDYAFSALFQCDPVIRELGGTPMDLSFLEGYEAYISGEAQGLSGLRVVGDYALMFTVRKEALPYFYELARFSFTPYPIQEIAPGCRVYDQGQGVFIANEESPTENTRFTKELLARTVLDPENGYLSHPKVVSGPYQLLSFDGETAKFVINTYYKGNEEGIKPSIWYLNYTLAENETMIQQLADKKFALLNKVTLAQSIQDGFQLSAQEYTNANYPRTGLTFIAFEPESEALRELPVRQALAHCMQKNELVASYVGGYGMGMDGLYGIGQWMYGLAAGTIAPPVELPENPSAEEEQAYTEALAEWETIGLDGIVRYDADVEEAIQLLESAGWNLNASGETFQREEDTVRYRWIDGELKPLSLRMAMPESAEAREAFEQYFVPNLRSAGIELTIETMEMDALVDAYLQSALNEYDLFYLGDDFNILFDPSSFFLAGDGSEEEGTLLAAHAELHQLCGEMTATEPTDVLGFMQKWLAFQQRFSELVPMLPVYGNVYFDFYTRELHDYLPAANVSWADAIVSAYMADVEEPEEGDALDSGEGDFVELDE